jgi:hypothetical protein
MWVSLFVMLFGFVLGWCYCEPVARATRDYGRLRGRAAACDVGVIASQLRVQRATTDTCEVVRTRVRLCGCV